MDDMDDGVVWTNGCFDLLHHGHVACLEWAAEQGALLYVGLNTDASVKRLKGPARPIIPYVHRRRMLLALRCVDVVVAIDDDPTDAIRAVRPDVLVKGPDYSDSTVLGAADVLSWGGRVAIPPWPRLPVSTTELITRIRSITP